MEPINENELFQALEELRPQPRPDFAAELDARVAAGFPRRSRLPRLSPAAALNRLRSLKPRHALVPAGGLVAAMLIALVVALSQAGSSSDDALISGDSTTAEMHSESSGGGERFAEPGEGFAEPKAVTPFSEESAGVAESLAEEQQHQPLAGQQQHFDGSGPYVRGADDLTNLKNRAIERSSQITLGTEPEQVGKASSEVFDVVHDYRGVVLSSRTSDGSAAHAEAKFELLIPSGKLGDAMAGFSRIGEVRSRHEETDDITAPTVSTGEQLEDSRARIDSLLGQLSEAETESEREAVERELRGERSRAAALQASLDNLERRASLSRVSLRIVGGEGISNDEGGAWGIGDALDNAGNVLGVAAAVTLLALAVLAPIALVALLIWLGRRTYLRRSRQAALG